MAQHSSIQYCLFWFCNRTARGLIRFSSCAAIFFLPSVFLHFVVLNTFMKRLILNIRIRGFNVWCMKRRRKELINILLKNQVPIWKGMILNPRQEQAANASSSSQFAAKLSVCTTLCTEWEHRNSGEKKKYNTLQNVPESQCSDNFFTEKCGDDVSLKLPKKKKLMSLCGRCSVTVQQHISAQTEITHNLTLCMWPLSKKSREKEG